MADLQDPVAQPFGADSHSSGVQVREAAARALAETSVASARRVHGLDEELPGEVGYNQERLRSPRDKVGPESSTSEGGPARGTTFFSGRVVQTSHHELGSATTSHQTSSRGRGQGEDLGGRLRNPSFDTPPPPLRDAQPPQRRADEGRPVLLPTDRPTAPQPAVRPQPTPHPRGPQRLHHAPGGRQKLLRSLQPNGNYHLTKLGKSFFKDKWVDWVVHMPVIIRGVRRNGRNRGMPYERTKRLPVTDLNVALSRQSEGLSDAQAARNLKASVLAQLGNPEPNDIILELSDETYYEGVDLQPAGHAGRGRPGAVFGLAYK